MVDFSRIEDMLTRINGQIDTRRLDRLSPLSAPMFFEPGKVPVHRRRARKAGRRCRARAFARCRAGLTCWISSLAGSICARFGSGALFVPGENLLCVSDLHFGKSERMARRGGALLPPYETRATLDRLDADLTRTGARAVICLGDSFDDLAAVGAMDEENRLWLTRLMAGRDWIWVEGNHDPGPINLGGTHRAQVSPRRADLSSRRRWHRV